MPAATTSGVDSKAKGNAKSRDHNQGNQDRKFTLEQKAEVVRVRKCSPNAFYDILGLGKIKSAATELEIKKAYRKISLLTHPDKNGHEHANEAFKMVSRAFGVLGDKDKRASYDRFGCDPDSKSGPQKSPNPFFSTSSGRASGSGSADNGNWKEEITPEEMFKRFFGVNTGARFDNNPGFFFNMPPGPGIRVHQFGGAAPRSRPRNANSTTNIDLTLRQALISILPILVVLILPYIAYLFSDTGHLSTSPPMRFENPIPPYTLQRQTNRLKLKYYTNPRDVENYSPSEWDYLDKRAELDYLNRLKVDCQREEQAKTDLIYESRGWIFGNSEKLQMAKKMPMVACKKLEKLGYRFGF